MVTLRLIPDELRSLRQQMDLWRFEEHEFIVRLSAN